MATIESINNVIRNFPQEKLDIVLSIVTDINNDDINYNPEIDKALEKACIEIDSGLGHKSAQDVISNSRNLLHA